MALKVRLTASLVLALAAAVGTGPAVAEPPHGKGGGHGQAEQGGKGGDKSRKTGNGGPREQSVRSGGGGGDLIRAGVTVAMARGYASEYRALGYSPLPPGVRKNLARGKPLPPGIAKKMVPPGMMARLPVYPGYEWRVAGTDLILVSLATLVIADVLADVFR